MATVVAAVELARVRQPVHVEGGQAEETEVKVEFRQQAGGTTRTQTAAQKVTPESTLLPQVSQASRAKNPFTP